MSAAVSVIWKGPGRALDCCFRRLSVWGSLQLAETCFSSDKFYRQPWAQRVSVPGAQCGYIWQGSRGKACHAHSGAQSHHRYSHGFLPSVLRVLSEQLAAFLFPPPTDRGIDIWQLIHSLNIFLNGKSHFDLIHLPVSRVCKICQAWLGCLCGLEKVDFRWGRSWQFAFLVLCSALIGRRSQDLKFSVDCNPFCKACVKCGLLCDRCWLSWVLLG